MAISKKFFVDIDLQGNGLNNSTVGVNTNMTKAGSFGYNAQKTRLEYFNGSLVEEVANMSDIAAVTGGLIFQGAYDAATNTPDIADGTALKGYFWVVTVAGTFLGETVQVGDSIIAKVDYASVLLTDWLILQGNVVIATTEVAGITYLATQEQVNGGTETGAYAVTPATLQGKLDPINTDITNLENDKLARDGSQAMTGSLDMGGNNVNSINNIYTSGIGGVDGNPFTLISNIDADSNAITNLPAPTNGGDATNKTYVDDQDALKLSLTGGTMSGVIDMGGNSIENINVAWGNRARFTEVEVTQLGSFPADNITLNNNIDANNASTIVNLPTPTNDGDATNKTYVDGVGATAESNANTYTDTAISFQSYRTELEAGAWTLVGDVYEATITHNITNTNYPLVTFTDADERTCEAIYQVISASAIKVYVNVVPTSLGVSLSAADPRL